MKKFEEPEIEIIKLEAVDVMMYESDENALPEDEF